MCKAGVACDTEQHQPHGEEIPSEAAKFHYLKQSFKIDKHFDWPPAPLDSLAMV